MATVQVPRKSKQQIVMRPEAIFGTDVFNDVYLLTDVLQVVSQSIRYTPEIEEIPNLATAGASGRLPGAIGKKRGTVSFDMVIRGRGEPYSDTVRPEADLPLRGSGCEAIVGAAAGAEAVTYKPTDNHESMTIYVVQEIPGGLALSAQLTGCLGTFRATGNAGGPMRYTFTFSGALEEEKDIPYVQPAIRSLPALPTLRSSNFHVGPWEPCVETVSFDMGNETTEVPCMNDVSGVEGYMISNRDPRIEANPNLDREENSHVWDSMEDGDPLVDAGWTLGQTQYNIVEFIVPQGQIINAPWGERDQIADRTLTIRATLQDAPNTDFEIVYS